MPRAVRWIAALVALAAILYVVGFFGYGALAYADTYLAGEPRDVNCETPGTQFRWPYEAVNYDRADDDALAAANPDMRHCATQGMPAGSDVVAPDGIRLDAWWVPAGGAGAGAGAGADPTGPTIVIVHGGKANKSGMLEYAPAFHDAYNLLIVDLRNAGRSDKTESTGGVREQADLRAMIDWLVATKHPTWIGVMGNSNGAATALAEARDDPRVRALILDSMHASVETQLGNLAVTEEGLPAWPGVWGVLFGVQLRLGVGVDTVDPVRTIGQVAGRPILLTHGGIDHVDRPADSLDRNVAAATAAGAEVEVHVCPTADHGQVVAKCGEQWTGWVRDFLARHGPA
jgi:pimeloyl-ACP methyl ester carboxylesterase